MSEQSERLAELLAVERLRLGPKLHATLKGVLAELEELNARINRAAVELTQLRNQETNAREISRLNGKIEGLRLAQDYLSSTSLRV